MVDTSKVTNRIQARSQAESPQLRRHRGVVQAIGSTGACTITLDGGTTQLAGVRRLDNIALNVGDTVEVIGDDTDLLVIGRIAKDNDLHVEDDLFIASDGGVIYFTGASNSERGVTFTDSGGVTRWGIAYANDVLHFRNRAPNGQIHVLAGGPLGGTDEYEIARFFRGSNRVGTANILRLSGSLLDIFMYNAAYWYMMHDAWTGIRGGILSSNAGLECKNPDFSVWRPMAASAFNVNSDERNKRDVIVVKDDFIGQAKSAKERGAVARFKRKDADREEAGIPVPQELGFVANRLPDECQIDMPEEVDEEQSVVSTSKGYSLSAVCAWQQRIIEQLIERTEDLETRLAALESA